MLRAACLQRQATAAMPKHAAEQLTAASVRDILARAVMRAVYDRLSGLRFRLSS